MVPRCFAAIAVEHLDKGGAAYILDTAIARLKRCHDDFSIPGEDRTSIVDRILFLVDLVSAAVGAEEIQLVLNLRSLTGQFPPSPLRLQAIEKLIGQVLNPLLIFRSDHNPRVWCWLFATLPIGIGVALLFGRGRRAARS